MGFGSFGAIMAVILLFVVTPFLLIKAKMEKRKIIRDSKKEQV